MKKLFSILILSSFVSFVPTATFAQESNCDCRCINSVETVANPDKRAASVTVNVTDDYYIICQGNIFKVAF